MADISGINRYSAVSQIWIGQHMKLAMIIIAALSAVSVALFYLTIDQQAPTKAVDMPWHIQVIDEQHTQVFGVVLNQTTLEQARERFGKLEGLALFQNGQGEYTLEAYFGKVSFGPLTARLIGVLSIPDEQIDGLIETSVKRVATEDGSIRWTLAQDQQVAQAGRKIRALTYIPGYSGMDQAYLEQQFGPADKFKQVDETTQIMFYPTKGLRIMVDNEGKEMFDYVPLSDFSRFEGEAS
jgi:hypothetical protein